MLVDLLLYGAAEQLWCAGSRCMSSEVAAHGPSCPRGRWNFPRPGIQPLYPALAGEFQATRPQGRAVLHSFLLTNSIPLWRCTATSWLSIYQWTDIWVGSVFRWLWIVLLWTHGFCVGIDFFIPQGIVFKAASVFLFWIWCSTWLCCLFG